MAYSNPNNPYSFIGDHYIAGLDSIIMTLMPPTVPAFGDFIDKVYDYISSSLFDSGGGPNKLEKQEIKIWINNSISGYINANRTINELQLNTAQMDFATQLVNGVFNVKNPEDIATYISDIEDKIIASKLTAQEQLPLLYATAVGLAAYDYWKVKGFDPMSSWYSYVNSFTPAIVKFPTWISASMEGTLISLSSMSRQSDNALVASIAETVNRSQGGDIVMAVSGSLGLGAGKVIYKWTQKAAL